MRTLAAAGGRYPGLAWLVLWAGFVLFLSLSGGLAGIDRSLLWSSAAAAALGLVAVIPRRPLSFAFVSALTVLALLAVFESYVAERTWQSPETVPELSYEWRNAVGRDLVSATKTYRFWRTEEPLGVRTLSFDVRLAEGSPGWYWRPSNPDMHVSLHEDAEGTFTRIHNSSGGDPWARQTFDVAQGIGGEQIRVELALRAGDSQEHANGNVQIYASEESSSTLAVDLSDEWQEIAHEWTPVDHVDATSVSIFLNDFDGATVDVRGLRLSVGEGDHREELLRANGAGVTTWLDRPDRESELRQHTCSAIPTAQWTPVRCEFEDPRLAGLETVRGVLQLEPELVVEMRDVRLSALDARAMPVPIVRRYSAFFLDHPNLLGHTAVAVGLAAIATTRRISPAFLGLVAAVVTIYLSGSRAALAGLVLGVLAWCGIALRTRYVVWILILSLGLSSLLLLPSVGSRVLPAMGLQNQSRLFGGEIGNAVARTEIWSEAWSAFLDHPSRGVRERYDEFASYWQATNPSAIPVTHAHNLWLQLAASYGAAGLVAGIWLTIGLLGLASAWGGGRGLLLVVPLLAMQLFDYTLFHSGVLYPLILGVNSLRLRR